MFPATSLTTSMLQLALSMSASSPQAVSGSSKQPVDQQALRRTQARPSCTHIRMIKVFGFNLSCSICQRVPSIGFVYVCEQYNGAETTASHAVTTKHRKKLVKARQRSAADLASLEILSDSVRKAINAGEYTVEQIEILLKQRRAVLDTIAKVIRRYVAPSQKPSDETVDNSPNFQKEEPTPKSQYVSSAAQEQRQRNEGNTNALSSWKRRLMQPCNFRVCHNCRPSSRDRTFVSFEHAFREEVLVSDQWSSSTMPVMDVSIIRGIGMDKPKLPTTAYLDGHFNDHNEARALASRVNNRPSTIFEAPEPEDDTELQVAPLRVINNHHRSASSSSNAFRTCLRRSLYDMLCHSYNWTEAAQKVLEENPEEVWAMIGDNEEFQIELWKVMMDHLLATAANTKLPGEDGHDYDLMDASSGSISPLPEDQVEHVRGGLAVTEEAVEEKMPDLITAA